MEETFKETLEIVKNSEKFKALIKEHPNLELCGGFFVIDFFGNDNKRSIDFKIGEKVYTFSLRDDNSVKFEEDKLLKPENPTSPRLEKIEKPIQIDLEEAAGIAKTRTLDEGIAAKFNKIIAVLQNYENKQVWNFTCMLEGLIIIHVIVNADSGDILKFERKSMMDLIRKK